MQQPAQRALVLITNSFPFGIGEAFLESEIGYLAGAFDRVVVIVRDVDTAGPARATAPNVVVQRVNPTSDLREKLAAGLLLVRHVGRVSGLVRDEVRYLLATRKSITATVARRLFHDLMKALVLSRHIQHAVNEHRLAGNVVLYSYWLTSSALATVFVTGTHVRRVARAHRIDLFEELHPQHYLSFRRGLVTNLDAVYSVSDVGAAVLERYVPSGFRPGIGVARLGTRAPARRPAGGTPGERTVVSCSHLIDVKRVHLIIEALAQLDAIPVRWVHFGDGPLRAALEKMASEKLPHRRVEFKGATPNAQVLRFYETTYVDVFINTSSSEGIPVSIMEAQSFGIPALALDVGGNGEIVSDATGALLPANSSASEIAGELARLLTLPEERTAGLRESTVRFWNERYNAAVNFPDFTTRLVRLLR